MKKKAIGSLFIVVALFIGTFASSVTVNAQAYGEGSYNANVYNDSRSDTGSNQVSDPTKTTAPDDPSRFDQNTDSPSQLDEDIAEDGNIPSKDSSDTDDTPAGEDGLEAENSPENTLLKWISLGAIVGAVLLVAVALIMKSRRSV